MAKKTLKYVGVSLLIEIPATPPFLVKREEPFSVDAELADELLALGCEVKRDKKGKVVELVQTSAAPFVKTRMGSTSEGSDG